jgi:hypothetical protein
MYSMVGRDEGMVDDDNVIMVPFGRRVRYVETVVIVGSEVLMLS